LNDIVIAIVLLVAAVFLSLVTLAARALVKNYDVDTSIQWRFSKGPFFSLGYGKQSLRVQSWLLFAASTGLICASAFFAFRALFAD
jgi:hypothetical protein